MAKVGKAPAYTPKQLDKAVDDYFKSITRTAPLYDSVFAGKDDKGVNIYEQVPRLNDKGEQVYGTEYFEHPSIIKLAAYLKVNRDTVWDYSKRDGYGDTIKRAKEKIESYLEDRLYGNNVTGIIFNLKNNYGWKDRQEIDANINVTKGLEDWLDE